MERALSAVGAAPGSPPPKIETITDQLAEIRRGMRELCGRLDGLVERVGVEDKVTGADAKAVVPESPRTDQIVHDIQHALSSAHEAMCRLERIA